MNKKEILLNFMNTSPNLIKEALYNANKKGDVYIITKIDDEKILYNRGYYKTEKTASRVLTELNNTCYYNDYNGYCSELQRVGDGMEIIKISISELFNLNSRELWINFIKNHGGDFESEVLLDEYIQHYKKKYSLNDEIIRDVKTIYKNQS